MSGVFSYRAGRLYADGVSLEQLAETYGTPLYVYSRREIASRYRALARAMAPVRPLICYSVKANSNLAVLAALREEGAGFDIVSGGELYRVERVGADPERVVFAGVGKTEEEIDYALREGILFFTVESEPEVRRISARACALGRRARVAFRVNPGVNPRTHRYITTGQRENKFGLDPERTVAAYEMAARLPNIDIVGLHMHIGSQILSPRPYVQALKRVAALCETLRSRYPSLTWLDIGGGMGIDYLPKQEPLAPKVFAAAVLPFLKKIGLQVILEPGRSLVGPAGVLLCRVQYVKDSYRKKFVIADAGMNDLIRPALYEAHHEVWPVRWTDRRIRGDLVGPVCESGDFIALDRELPAVDEGDLLAVMNAGAYGFSMASNYNSRRRPAEVMVDDGRHRLIRARESWADLVRGEEDGGSRRAERREDKADHV